MTDRQQFLKAIRERPDDNDLRLIYADHLDSEGESARAEFIRVQVELARQMAKLCDCGGEFRPLKRDFLPLMSMCDKCHTEGPFWKAIEGLRCTGSQNYRISAFCSDPACRLCVLMHRQDQLFIQVAGLDSGRGDGHPARVRHYTRGLLTEVPLTAVEVVTRLDGLLEWNPIHRVVMSGRLEVTGDRDGGVMLATSPVSESGRHARRCSKAYMLDTTFRPERKRLEYVLWCEWPNIIFEAQWGTSEMLDRMNAAFMSGVAIPPSYIREQLGLPEPTE